MSTAAKARIETLLDANSFVEIGSLVKARSTDFNLNKKDTPSDGVITGYGLVDGNLVYVYSQDASVLGGSMGEMHAKKICRLYDLAMKVGAPVIGLLDCSGLRLEEGCDALNAFGELYLKQTESSGVILQITAVFGTCGGGLSIVPAVTDFTFMAEDAKLFVTAPNAIPGNKSEVCDSASAKFQSKEAGNVDFTGSEEEVLGEIRRLVSMLPMNNEDSSYDDCTDDLNRICEGAENCAADPALALAIFADNHEFIETKGAYAKDMVTGFLKLNGVTVGAVANRSVVYDEEGNMAEKFDAVLTAAGCGKAAEFVSFCDAFQIPVVTLVNVKGYEASLCAEKHIAKAAARLTYAYANATVPKVTVITGEASGTAYNVMNSKAVGADIVYAWPQAKIGMMDADMAVRIIYADEIAKAEDAGAFIREKAAEYDTIQGSAATAAARGYVDTIIEAADTRKYLIGALEMLYTKREARPNKKHGTL